jgi:hypothetical protein
LERTQTVVDRRSTIRIARRNVPWVFRIPRDAEIVEGEVRQQRRLASRSLPDGVAGRTFAAPGEQSQTLQLLAREHGISRQIPVEFRGIHERTLRLFGNRIAQALARGASIPEVAAVICVPMRALLVKTALSVGLIGNRRAVSSWLAVTALLDS